MAKKPNSWQKVGIQAKFRRFLVFVGVILLILFILNTFLHVFTIGQFFKKPLSKDVSSEMQGANWNGKTKLVIVFDTNPLTVAVFDPKNKRVDAIIIDRETRSDMPYSYGWNRLGAVRDLGNLDNGTKGNSLLVDTMAKFLQTPVDGFVIVHDDAWQSLDAQKITDGVRSFSSVKTFPKIISSKDWQSRFETNLTKFDVLRLWWGLRGVRSDKVIITDLSREGLLTDILLPDGSHGFGPEEVSIAAFSKKVFFDDLISQEKLNIEVLNGTDTPGIASNVARLVENVGGNVVRVANSEVENKDLCAIRASKANTSKYTTLRLAKALRCDIEEVQTGGDESQADLTILVGRDLIGRF